MHPSASFRRSPPGVPELGHAGRDRGGRCAAGAAAHVGHHAGEARLRPVARRAATGVRPAGRADSLQGPWRPPAPPTHGWPALPVFRRPRPRFYAHRESRDRAEARRGAGKHQTAHGREARAPQRASVAQGYGRVRFAPRPGCQARRGPGRSRDRRDEPQGPPPRGGSGLRLLRSERRGAVQHHTVAGVRQEGARGAARAASTHGTQSCWAAAAGCKPKQDWRSAGRSVMSESPGLESLNVRMLHGTRWCRFGVCRFVGRSRV